MKTTLAALLLLCLLLPSPARAGDDGPRLARSSRDSETLLLFVENDKFLGGTDEEYTNGVMLTWVSPDLTPGRSTPDQARWVRALLDELDPWLENFPELYDPSRQRSVSVSLGQNLYTPRDVYSETPPDNQRPYAAWLFTTLALHSKSETELNTLALTLGVVGPSALGEEVQNNFHNAIGSRRSEGWSHQLHDEPGLMLTWQRDWRLIVADLPTGLGFDVLPHAGVTVGNVATYANLGGEVRFGYNLPADFGTALIGPGGGVSAPVALNSERLQSSRWWGFHVFAGTDGRAVARDIFLDGNTWENSPHVSKEPFVADFLAGAALTLGDVKITYTQAWRTQEYEGQPGGCHNFGSLSIAYTF
ncbi:MAG TPA: lipid A deacylase LpxR family protein [Desulfovibrio sp.]|jgi:hypothetical protein|uniref:lipid A deacylase LpxR family protein n=1 Tax=Desulfovibrio sp. TaxID=885 RepID=UPI002A4709A6|nr:lipid A deacylase LpxR family protein [Desulfovibrio sp.]MDY0306560.1 lipid A deacylase LpxR family protein [Desulfovibrionaceae bacterium]HMM40024.1 lipid A deacylase LpxR family protein [Desulfovibrio sp.]